MNLDTELRTDLWNEVSTSYEAKAYKDSIINAINFLTKIIREKTDSDLDGYKLVGESFGGKNPKLKLNKMETQSEFDEQEGFLQILSGIYKGIRNPRSHETITDTKVEADAIILFLNYIINIIDKSKSSFVLETFIGKVFDPDFVKKDEYATELLREIPRKMRCEVLIRIFQTRENGESEQLSVMTRAIISALTDADTSKFMNVVSHELQTSGDQSKIISAIRLFPEELWARVSKAPKMRIENKMINSIMDGEIILSSNNLRDIKGALGTWASSGLIKYFDFIDDVRKVILNKITDDDWEDNLYIFKYFLSDFPLLFSKDEEIILCANVALKLIHGGITSFLEDLFLLLNSATGNWRPIFIERFVDVTDNEKPTFIFSDGTPFLGKEVNYPLGDGLPF